MMNSYIPPLPPPPPPPFERKPMSYGVKILLLGLQGALLMIGALSIWLMSYSREGRSREVAQQIVQDWGREVYMNGPVAVANRDSAECVRPEEFVCHAQVGTMSLHRNIYEAEVFNAGVSLSGSFCGDSLRALGDTVILKLSLSTKQIQRLSPLTVGDRKTEWSVAEDCLLATVATADMPASVGFSTDFDVRGSGGVYIKRVGTKSSVSIDGEASNPSFESLPDERNVWKNRFSASWQDSGLHSGSDSGYAGAEFLIGVDRYQKVSRSLKYAFIIIMLTYISVLLAEVVMKRTIPLLNYFLIGAALILFYSLLLAFTEHMSFGASYMIASFMTVALIAGYMWRMLVSWKAALVIGAILTGFYASCYIMLSLSTYALLLGSLILFAALAAMMYGSLHIRRH